MAAPTEPPELRLLRGRGLAFAPGAARALRERLHVTGALVGPRPRGGPAPGGARPGRLPVLLLPEELRLLREGGAVRVRGGQSEAERGNRAESEAERGKGSGAQDEPEQSPTDPLSQEPSAPPPPVDRSCPSPSACPTHEHRYRVYKDLWGRGLYLTHGGKFGGDFLVYPGPPARFHASALALCLAPGSGLAPGSLVAAARLGTHVRKTLLLCSAGPPGGAPAYTSLQWRADLA